MVQSYQSKPRWHNEGEKNTKYFLNLENQYKQGTISRLKRNENDYTMWPLIRKFYMNAKLSTKIFTLQNLIQKIFLR